MALTNAWDKAQVSDSAYPYRIAVEILYSSMADQTSDSNWCDINKPVPAAATDKFYGRLLRPPTIEVKSEVRPGRFATSISSLVLDDWDATFGKQLPWTMWSIGSSPTQRSLNTWYHARVRIRIGHHVGTATAWVWITLGVFIIEDIARDCSAKTATMKLVGLEKILMDSPAASARAGDTWMVNAPIKVVAKRIVDAAGSSTSADPAIKPLPFESGSPPENSWITSDRYVFSILGSPPLLTTGGEWIDHPDFVPRHMFYSRVEGEEDVLFMVGHTISTNKPMIVRWARNANTWKVLEIDAAGYEAVFACNDADVNPTRLHVFLINNSTFGSNTPCNHTVLVKVYTSTTLGYLTTAGPASAYMPIWLCTEGTMPPSGAQQIVWGCYDDAAPRLGQNVPCFFRSCQTVPGYYPDDVPTYSTVSADSGGYVPKYCPTHKTLRTGTAVQDAAYERDPGFYCLATPGYEPTPAWPARSPVLADYVECFKYDATRSCVYFISWYEDAGHTTGIWYLSRYNLSDSTVSGGQTIGGMGGIPSQPSYFLQRNITAFDVCATSSSAGKVWIATQELPRDNLDYQDDSHVRTRLFEFSWPAHGTNLSGPTDITAAYDTSQRFYWSQEWEATLDDCDHRHYAPIIASIRHNRISTSKYPIWGVVVDRRQPHQHTYGIWTYSDSGPIGPQMNAYRHYYTTFPMSACPLVISEQEWTMSTSFYMIQDQASGQIYHLSLNATDGVFGIEQEVIGTPCDEESTWASAGPIPDTWYGGSIGVSAPGPPSDARIPLTPAAYWSDSFSQYGAKAPAGRISLWNENISISDIIRVADFRDANSWDALNMLRLTAGDYIMGFSRAGELMFKPRTSGTPTLTLYKAGDNFVPVDMSSIGCANLTTDLDHGSVVNSITITPRLARRSPPDCELIATHNSKAGSMAVTANYTGNRAQRVVLRCIKGGRPVTVASGLDEAPVLFSWYRSNADLTTSLASPMGTGENYCIVYGLYADGSGNVRLGDGSIEVGDSCIIGDGDAVLISAIYVTSGMLEFSGAIGGSDTHPVGTAVRIIPIYRSSAGDSTDGVCALTSDVAIPRLATTPFSFTVDDNSSLSLGMVLYYETGYIRVVELSGTTGVIARHLVLGHGKGSTSTWPSGAILRGAIWPQFLGRSYAVSNTGACFSITEAATDSRNTGSFSEGDRIVVTCYGMELGDSGNALVRSQNSASIKRYGTKEYKLGDDHLMDTPRAMAMIDAMSDWAWPTYITKATGCPLLQELDIGDLVYVKNSHLFPSEAGYRVAHAVTGIKYDLDRGTMDLTLRSTSTAGRGDTAGAGGAAQPRFEGYGRRR